MENWPQDRAAVVWQYRAAVGYRSRSQAQVVCVRPGSNQMTEEAPAATAPETVVDVPLLDTDHTM
jgi:hypothetical protein